MPQITLFSFLMKFQHAYIYIIIFVFAVGCNQKTNHPEEIISKKVDSAQFHTSIHWIDSVINLGKIKMGDTIPIVYRFTNTGNRPLLVQGAETSCSCTSVKIPDQAIPPGSTGEIRALLDTRKSIVGFVHKGISVSTNTYPGKKVLLYRGEIWGHKTLVK